MAICHCQILIVVCQLKTVKWRQCLVSCFDETIYLISKMILLYIQSYDKSTQCLLECSNFYLIGRLGESYWINMVWYCRYFSALAYSFCYSTFFTWFDSNEQTRLAYQKNYVSTWNIHTFTKLANHNKTCWITLKIAQNSALTDLKLPNVLFWCCNLWCLAPEQTIDLVWSLGCVKLTLLNPSHFQSGLNFANMMH